MAKKFSEIYEAKTPEPTGDLKDACWKGYVAVGTKKKNGKTVPNCVPETSEEAMAYKKKCAEELSAKQKKLDHNKNGKIDGADLKKLRQEESCGCDCGEDPCVECGESHHAIKEAKDPNEYDKEGDMAKTQLKTICRNAEDLMKMMGDDDNLPEWVQGKITKAEDYISSVRDYLQSEKERVNEESFNIVKNMGKSFKDFMKK